MVFSKPRHIESLRHLTIKEITCDVASFTFRYRTTMCDPNLLTESLVLRKAGVKSSFEDGKTIDAKTFSRARVSKVGKSNMYKQTWGEGQRLVEVIGACRPSRTRG